MNKLFQKLKKYLWVVGLGLFLYVALKVDWLSVWQIFKQANIWFLFLGFLLVIPMLLLKTLRWRIFVRLLGDKTPFSKLFLMVNKSVFWAIAVPGRIGAFSRAKYLSDSSSTSLIGGIWSVATHIILDILDTCFLGAFSLLIFSYLFSQESPAFNIAIFLALLVVSGCIVFYILIKKGKGKFLFRFLFNFLVPSPLKEKAENFFSEMITLTQRINLSSLCLSFCYELLQIAILGLAEILIARALGIDVPFWFILLVIPLFDFVVAMPFSVFGIGVREASYIFFFSFLAININQATAFSLLLGVWTLANTLPGLLLYFASIRRMN